MKIGVFDSGRGGEFIADGLKVLLPHHEYIVVNDRKNVPYGSRTNDEVAALTNAAIQPLLAQKCSIIVIACNTATMAAITSLRANYPKVQFVGIEPMLKPAATLSRSRHITVLATPLTLQSSRYQELVAKYGKDMVVDQPDASGWAAAIEYDQLTSISFAGVGESVAEGSDVIVLACTHYLLLKPRLEVTFPGVTVLEPTEAIAQQITALLA